MPANDNLINTLLDHYRKHGRYDLPWRVPDATGLFDPYKIMVSEIMLQQTQVARVIAKYQEFTTLFPTVHSLAEASLADVLRLWVGLGYNRRARYLHDAAKLLMSRPEPWTYEDLVACKGIGPNTAAAILVYSYDLPLVFIETNIRTVIIHHYFADKQGVPDKDILHKMEQITAQIFAPQNIDNMDKSADELQRPRVFYWALMDYGSYLKSTAGNTSRQSKTYVRQSVFAGSRRQVRGKVIAALSRHSSLTITQLRELVDDSRLDDVLAVLVREQLIQKHVHGYSLFGT